VIFPEKIAEEERRAWGNWPNGGGGGHVENDVMAAKGRQSPA